MLLRATHRPIPAVGRDAILGLDLAVLVQQIAKRLVRAIDVPPAEVMKFIVSAGVADWD